MGQLFKNGLQRALTWIFHAAKRRVRARGLQEGRRALLAFQSGSEICGLMAAMAVLAGGCATPANTTGTAPPTPAPTPARQPASDKRFVIAPELDRILHVVSVRLYPGADGYLKTQVTVRNMTQAPQTFDYRIEWFDKDGALLPAISRTSQRWMLLGGETSAIAVTAPAATAADFGIAFLPARD